MFEGLVDPSMGIYGIVVLCTFFILDAYTHTYAHCTPTATTAANAYESSWGTFCPPDDKVGAGESGSG